jgi:hypothetical protein
LAAQHLVRCYPCYEYHCTNNFNVLLYWHWENGIHSVLSRPRFVQPRCTTVSEIRLRTGKRLDFTQDKVSPTFMRRAQNPQNMSRTGARAEHLPEVSHRSSLFGSSLGARSEGVAASSSMQQALEEDNNRLTDELSQKVSALRFASQSIHDEVSEQNRMLSGMVRSLRHYLFVCLSSLST